MHMNELQQQLAIPLFSHESYYKGRDHSQDVDHSYVVKGLQRGKTKEVLTKYVIPEGICLVGSKNEYVITECTL